MAPRFSGASFQPLPLINNNRGSSLPYSVTRPSFVFFTPPVPGPRRPRAPSPPFADIAPNRGRRIDLNDPECSAAPWSSNLTPWYASIFLPPPYLDSLFRSWSFTGVHLGPS